MNAAPVVIYVGRGPFHQDGTSPSNQSSGPLPVDVRPAAEVAVLDRGRVFDPHRAHREFPERWQQFIRANYGDYASICQAFGVCERTARKWWDGETGARGVHVAMALRQHGQGAWDALIGEAA